MEGRKDGRKEGGKERMEGRKEGSKGREEHRQVEGSSYDSPYQRSDRLHVRHAVCL